MALSAAVGRVSEAAVRTDLAATYRLCDKLGLNEGIDNHLTALVPGSRGDRFLVIRYGLLWSEVTAENLVLVDADGTILAGEGPVETTAFEIHRAIHLQDPDKYACVFHTHQPWSTALCCADGVAEGLAMCHQNSCRFHDDIAFDPAFNGLVHDRHEGDRLASALDGKRVLLHRSHGVIVCGRSVAEAFDDLYYLERAAQAQVLALSTGRTLSIIRDEVVRGTKAAFDADKAEYARLHLDAWKRQLDREQGPSHRSESSRRVGALSALAAVALGMAASLLLTAARQQRR